jgi:hypothetical protein
MHLDKGFAPQQPEHYLLRAGFDNFLFFAITRLKESVLLKGLCTSQIVFRLGTQRSVYRRLNSAAARAIPLPLQKVYKMHVIISVYNYYLLFEWN